MTLTERLLLAVVDSLIEDDPIVTVAVGDNSVSVDWGSGNDAVPVVAESGNNANDLRTRIAKVIWRTFQNTPPIEATDEEWGAWWVQGGDHEQKFYYQQADAVIAELDLGIPCAANGCRVRRIARYHAEKSSQLSEADDE